jgi:hypothetical protein
VFVDESVLMPIHLADARDCLANYFDHSPAVQTACSAAFQHGLTLVAPRPTPPLARGIVARWTPPYWRGGVAVAPIRWSMTTNVADDLPPLDANLELGPSQNGAPELALRGSYRLPMAALGATVDQTTLDTVARTTCRVFLFSVAAALDANFVAPEEFRNRADSPVPDE